MPSESRNSRLSMYKILAVSTSNGKVAVGTSSGKLAVESGDVYHQRKRTLTKDSGESAQKLKGK